MDNFLTIMMALLGVIIPWATYLLMRKSVKTNKEKVIVAEAGKVSDMQSDYVPFVYMNPVKIKGSDNSIIDTTNLLRVLVRGYCMIPAGIMDGSQLFVEKINKEEAFSPQVTHGDVMLIYLADKNIYKLRIFDKFDKDENLLTYRYDQQTQAVQYSTKSHTIESVIGVVKYKYVS